MSIPKTATAVVLLVVAGVAVLSACDPVSYPTGNDGGATVVGIDYSRDPNHPTTGTHQAECSDHAGNGWLVTITAAQADRVSAGDPCPAGAHEPLPQQQHPEMWSALNTPLPYHGGDPNSPCGEWEAASQQDANQMRTAWDTCMTHSAGRR
ncbi:hypothetical protein F0L68_41150 [Solihabitans fulvus]|uniref:Lipoprotein n=1 Tax=Solihabitans fulvus TaxID=1892852 RepID=A0A5B2W434_9PSEU|nr:hypothetical protein [Solihabitans fulvus]KAA2245894.1 hypothetical protein F0L68_41150 [Solihabitans fulvus]